MLVTGGAGYIGSHTVGHLLAAGHEVVVYDDLSSGHRDAVPEAATAVWADLADAAALRDTFATHRPDAVVHFAGAIEAGESMTDPRRFWHSNVGNSLRLADALAETRTPLVFSSSSAVYGEPDVLPIPEDAPKLPTNVYGYTKLAVEHLLAHYWHAYGLPSTSLRYFNACGARPDGENGADHPNKTHLMTLALLTALGQRTHLDVYGTDYPTRDGTCVRDYVHVEDLASAHVAALDALLADPGARQYNVGLGHGFTVLEVIAAVERVTGKPLPVRYAGRREGDPAALVADPARIRHELGWTARYTDLTEVVATAWKWHTSHPDGFGQ